MSIIQSISFGMPIRASQVSPLKSRIKQLIQSIRAIFSVGDIRQLAVALNQIRSLNPTIADQLMGQLILAIQQYVDSVMAHATVSQAHQCLNDLGRCVQAIPSLEVRVSSIQQRLDAWIESQSVGNVQPKSPSAAVHYAAMQPMAGAQTTVPVRPLTAPVLVKPVIVGGIFIEPYRGLVVE